MSNSIFKTKEERIKFNRDCANFLKIEKNEKLDCYKFLEKDGYEFDHWRKPHQLLFHSYWTNKIVEALQSKGFIIDTKSKNSTIQSIIEIFKNA